MTVDLHVLQLVTTERSFFETQVRALETQGIESTVVAVPSDRGGRGVREYVSFALQALGTGLETFDLVHANYGLTAPFAFAQPTRPVVLTLWGSDVMGPGWLRRLSLAAARRADAVVAPSAALGAELGEVEHEVVPFGVDTALFRPVDRQEARDRVGWDDGPNVLFPYDPARSVKNYPLAERVAEEAGGTLRTVSGVAYEEMPCYVNAADALLVTSDREAGPMVVREAAACNVPVVSTDVGFARATLETVDGSTVATTRDGLVSGLERAFEAGRSDGRRTVENLTIDDMGRRIAGIYRRST